MKKEKTKVSREKGEKEKQGKEGDLNNHQEADLYGKLNSVSFRLSFERLNTFYISDNTSPRESTPSEFASQ